MTIRSAGGEATRALVRERFALPTLIRPRKVMASPPTVTFGTSSAGGTLTKDHWAATNNTVRTIPTNPVRGGFFGYARTKVGQSAAGIASVGTLGINGNVNTTGTSSTLGPGMFQASFEHYGEMCEIMVGQTNTAIMVRVDDEYVSLTPQALGSTANAVNYMKLAFGSRGYRRIDIIGAASFNFHGVKTEPGDMLAAAPIRGPRVIIVGDSFSQPGLQGWGAYFADAMGWDDVWQAGVGGTGWVNNAVGASLPFASRVASDVIPHGPDIVYLYGSVNDAAQSPATCGANAATATAAIRAALPNCLVVGGYNAVGGIEAMTANHLDVMDAVEAGITGAGGIWLNPVELPLEYYGTAPTTTLAAAHSAGRVGANPNTAPFTTGTAATGLYCNQAVGAVNLRVGSTVEVGTGATRERLVLLSFTQINGTAGSYTFDGVLQYAHSSGETVSEVGASYMTGSGQVGSTTSWGSADTLVSSDGVHPSVEGAQLIGLVQAQLLRDWLARMTPLQRKTTGISFGV